MIKSIFARPVFINPQAYLVIPQLANLSMLEPIDFTSTNIYSFESLGKVESKIISAKDEYILHIDLYESYGSCVLGEFYIGPATIGSIDDFTITTNGYITTIEVGGGDSGNIVYPGLIAAWSAKGKTNDDEDRATLRDLTGNGHDITLNGFAFSEMSGYGGYNYTYDNWTNTVNAEINGNVAIINGYPSTRSVLEKYLGTSTPKTILRLKVSIEIKNNPNKLPIRMYFTGAADYPSKYINITESGIYELPQVTSNNYELSGYYIGFQLNNNNLMECDENYYCRIELLPEYPDALVFDGVDDYGQSINKIKALTEYTVVLKRNIIKPIVYAASFYKGEGGDDVNSNFFIEYYDAGKWYYGNGSSNTEIKYYDENIIYVTEKSYNGKTIDMDFGNVVDNPVYLGKITGYWCHSMAFYSAYLFDRSLDEQEIKEFIRKYIDPEYLLPSEIPTPDCYYDFSLGSNDDENRETIKDQSGNGNDAKAYNIAWSGLSGYGGYQYNWLTDLDIHISNDILNITHNKLKLTKTTSGWGYIASLKIDLYKNKSFKLNVHYETKTGSIILQNSDARIRLEEGINIIPIIDTTSDIHFSILYGTTAEIELLPEYEWALVLDGVDDYIALEAFTSGFNTMFMLVNPLSDQRILYDQRNEDLDDYAVFNNGSNVAHNARNKNGTYINGKLNTTILSRELVNKKHLIMVISESLSSKLPIIGSNNNHNGLFSSMAIYKFLGFKEKLTEEQIQAIIKKYNLLDGVDEIEVS